MSRYRDPVPWDSTTVRAGGRDVPVRLYRPAAPRSGWLVWAHGGSWQAGSAREWHHACADLARLAGCTLVSVDYRLAPRHPHPAALHDVLAVLDWARVAAGRAELGGRSGGVAVGGDSAGGTIAACAALVLRDMGRPLAAQVLAYPPVDPDCAAASYTRQDAGFPSREWMLAAWRAYRGTRPVETGQDGAAYSTPLETRTLAGLAPAVLAVGALDPVADDVRGYARQLRAAGNSVVFREFPAMGHGSFLWPAGDGPGAANPLRQWLATAVRDLLARRSPAGETTEDMSTTTRRTA